MGFFGCGGPQVGQEKAGRVGVAPMVRIGKLGIFEMKKWFLPLAFVEVRGTYAWSLLSS